MKFVGRFSRFDRKPKAGDTVQVVPHSYFINYTPPVVEPEPVPKKKPIKPVKVARPFPTLHWPNNPNQPELIFEENGSVGEWWEYTCTPANAVRFDEWCDPGDCPSGMTGGSDFIHYRLKGCKPGIAEIAFFLNFRDETITPRFTYRVEVDEKRNITILQTVVLR